MPAFLQFWDKIELWLATLPFPLQVAILLAMGIPLFILIAVVVERAADILVRRFRKLTTPRTIETGKEVR
ncbi:hypothetical protein [Dietzia sp. ANT_WB102]|uniref:hypothetical protein n=1 Tax=Dietzia sp. ANT_WB102 TaxID=2597345 RepID=UPI0011EF5252|nr:hypothetical protein [Dietzia sp. ANT_WB102]KAA0917170.1 hypothetical protein FQ137_13240 [Dietzia sp. ANT_WB102]